LAVDIFLLSVTYLESIKRKLKIMLKRNVSVELINRDDFNLKQAIESATHDIFISGSALASLVPYIDLLQNTIKNKNIYFRLLSLDFDDYECVNQFCKLTGLNNTFDRMKKQDIAFNIIRTDVNIVNNKYIEIKKIDKVMPFVYIGVDIYDIRKTSYIKVQQYLHEKSGSDSLNFIIKPGNELFVYYQEQIKILWDKLSY